jgi:hypothetical protein
MLRLLAFTMTKLDNFCFDQLLYFSILSVFLRFIARDVKQKVAICNGMRNVSGVSSVIRASPLRGDRLTDLGRNRFQG